MDGRAERFKHRTYTTTQHVGSLERACQGIIIIIERLRALVLLCGSVSPLSANAVGCGPQVGRLSVVRQATVCLHLQCESGDHDFHHGYWGLVRSRLGYTGAPGSGPASRWSPLTTYRGPPSRWSQPIPGNGRPQKGGGVHRRHHSRTTTSRWPVVRRATGTLGC